MSPTHNRFHRFMLRSLLAYLSKMSCPSSTMVFDDRLYSAESCCDPYLCTQTNFRSEVDSLRKRSQKLRRSRDRFDPRHNDKNNDSTENSSSAETCSPYLRAARVRTHCTRTDVRLRIARVRTHCIVTSDEFYSYNV